MWQKAVVLLSVSGLFVTFGLGFAVLTPNRAAAEPILGNEALTVPTPSPREQDAADALSLFKAGDFNVSLNLWKEVVKKNPDMPPAQVIMAGLYLRSGMIQEAKLALDLAIMDAPDDPETYFLQANVAMREGDVDKADSLLEKAEGLLAAFDKSANRKEALQFRIDLDLARVAATRKDWAVAQKQFEKCLIRDAKNTGIRQRLAYCLFRQQDAEGALEKLREVAGDNPTMITPEAALAQFYGRVNDQVNAKKWMKAAVTAAPKNLKTRLAAGQFALESGKLSEALRHAIAATQIDSSSVEAKLFRALTALYQHDFMTAESILDGVLKKSPQNVVATNNLALALIVQDDEAKSRRALELAEANAEQFPKWPEIVSTYAIVLYKLGRLDDAEEAVLAAKSIASTDGDTAYLLARIAIDRGDKDKARQLLETVLSGGKAFMFQPDAEELLEELKNQ